MLSTGEIDDQGRIVHAIAANPITRWITAYKGLCQIAELAEKHDVIYSLEPLNTKTDHAGYPLARTEDAARLVEEVGSPRIRLLLDVYHTQIEEGNVTQVIRDFGKLVGYVHVADVPGRHEPGTGEINYPHVVQTLREIGYRESSDWKRFPPAIRSTHSRGFAKFSVERSAGPDHFLDGREGLGEGDSPLLLRDHPSDGARRQNWDSPRPL